MLLSSLFMEPSLEENNSLGSELFMSVYGSTVVLFYYSGVVAGVEHMDTLNLRLAECVGSQGLTPGSQHCPQLFLGQRRAKEKVIPTVHGSPGWNGSLEK